MNVDFDAILSRTEPFRDEAIAVGKTQFVERAQQVDLDEFRKELEESDMDTGFIDEKVAAAMRTMKDPSFTQSDLSIAQMFKTLKPEQKAAVLATYTAAGAQGVGQKAPMWIDEAAVPDNIRCAWLSVTIIGALGMRGYTRVRRTTETVKWVPNFKSFGASKWIRNGPMVLCAIPSAVKLAQEADEYHSTNDFVVQQDERFRSALRSIAGSIGMSLKDVGQRDAKDTGIIATRGLDPGSLEKPDLVAGEGEEDFEYVDRPKL